MNKIKTGFNVRAFVTLMITFSALGLPVTGVANHLYGFSPPTIARHAWMSAHNVLGILFVAFSTWHVVFNRRTLWKYIRGAVARVPAVSREAIIAGIAVSGILLLFVGHAIHDGG